jgi:hypothetical protein
MNPLSFLLDFNVEIAFTFRATNGMLPLFIGKPHRCPTIGAFTVAVGFAIAKFIFLQFEKSGKFTCNFQILLVFRLALIKILGKNPKKHPNGDQNCQKMNRLKEIPRQNQYQIDPNQKPIQGIGAVASIHKADQPLFKFHPFSPQQYGQQSFARQSPMQQGLIPPRETVKPRP